MIDAQQVVGELKVTLKPFVGLMSEKRFASNISLEAPGLKLQLQDKTLAWGTDSLGLYGLFNFPHATIVTAADNGSGSTDWDYLGLIRPYTGS